MEPKVRARLEEIAKRVKEEIHYRTESEKRLLDANYYYGRINYCVED